MTLKIAEKFACPKRFLRSSDLSLSKKEYLYGKLASLGASRSFVYTRFFRTGFDEWELDGIDSIIRDFVVRKSKLLLSGAHNLQFLSAEEVRLMSKGTPERIVDTLLSYINSSHGNFYKLLGAAHLRNAFRLEMQEKGMCFGSLCRRFTLDDWKPFERCGIRKIWKDFLVEIENVDKKADG